MINDPLDVFMKDFSENEEIIFQWYFLGNSFDRSVKAIFDNSFFDSSIGETVMDTTSPRVTVKATDAVGIPHEATVTIRGQSYSVSQIQPDGTGFSTIMLAHE